MKSAFVDKAAAVGAFSLGGVGLMSADFDFFEGAAVAFAAMELAVVDAAMNVFVSFFHNEKPPIKISQLFCPKRRKIFG